MKSFFVRLKSEIKKSGWAFVIIYIFLVVNLFTVQGQGIVIGVILILIAIFFDVLNRKKNSQSPALKIIRKIVAIIKLIFVILIGLGLAFLPDVGPIGVPWSFALGIGFFIFAAHIIYLIKDIKKRDKFGIFWCLFVLTFYPIGLYFNGFLWDKGINDMKRYSIEMQDKCNLDTKCKNLGAPWTKDWKNIKVDKNSFKMSIVHMETYYTFTGGVNQDLLLEIHNIDIDFAGKNKKLFRYIDNNWALQK